MPKQKLARPARIKPRLSTTARVLICDHSLNVMVEVCLNVFMSAYLYQLSEQNLLPLALFNLSSYATTAALAVITGGLAKRRNKLVLYRLGVVAMIVEFLAIFALGERVVDLAFLVGMLNGVMIALHAFIRNMIDSENVSSPERLRYTGFNQAAGSVTSILVPVLLGAYISLESFQSALLIMLVVAFLQMILSFYFKNPRPVGGTLKLAQFRRIYRRDRTLWRLYWFEFFRGINRVGLMRILVPILILMQFDSDLELGGLTSVFYICNFAAMYLFGKFYQGRRQKMVLGMSLLFVLACTLATIWQVNVITVALYNLAYYVPMYLIENIGLEKLFSRSNLGRYRAQYNIEYFIYREFYVDAGRVVSFGALAAVAGLGLGASGIYALLGMMMVSVAGMVAVVWGLGRGDR